MEHPRITINVWWEAPPVPWHIINIDGAVQHGVAGCGGVLRDHQGAWIGGYSKNIGSTNASLLSYGECMKGYA
jgi:hypothetical protein